MSAPGDGLSRVYVVFWPKSGVFKIGFSTLSRWRTFVSRGADVVELYAFDSHEDAFAVETWLQASADELTDRAFPECTDEARKLLGHNGSGYLECYRGDMQTIQDVIDDAIAKGLEIDAQA